MAKKREIAKVNYKKMVKEKGRVLSLKKMILLIVIIAIILTVIIEFAFATKYKTMIEVISENNTILISPIKSALDFGGLPAGSGESRHITLENKGSRPTMIAILVFGDVGNWMRIDKNYFTLNGGENATVTFRLFIPPTASLGKYNGDIYILRLP